MIQRLLFVLAIGGIVVTTVSAQEQSAQGPPRLRVLTYNIHHGEGMDGRFDYDRLAKIINELKPDLVAVQEVDVETERADGIDQATLLGKMTNMHHAFGNALYYSGGQYGEAILSRFPLTQIKAHHLPFRPRQEPRTALAVRVKPENGLPELVFVGTHLCHQSNETRTEQAERLNLLYGGGGDIPVILAGDLNARPGSEPMDVLLKEDWVDAISPKSRIDYVLYRKVDPWKVVEVQIVDERVASDHLPVLVVLEWPAAAHPQPKR